MGCSGSKSVASKPSVVSKPPQGDFVVHVKKTAAVSMLGMTILGSTEPEGLRVQNLKDDGIIAAHNREFVDAPNQQVKVGDIIVAVNAVFGDYNDMRKELDKLKLALTLKRPPAATLLTAGQSQQTACEPHKLQDEPQEADAEAAQPAADVRETVIQLVGETATSAQSEAGPEAGGEEVERVVVQGNSSLQQAVAVQERLVADQPIEHAINVDGAADAGSVSLPPTAHAQFVALLEDEEEAAPQEHCKPPCC
eukprot:TRINITY_DN27905_c0_g1_i1.p1 TRINITY_DN27905_c0_g1~~TRINITY_DN27905_c0_g1_i1.p1  ORF type:complete len:252 (+),score=48.69 TRINITY_DN27905_c0_g1_i1:55-810(+)